ncbi:MAG TPA: 8-amino-7-oxononanoate synthase [Fibrobacteria bacterium]|nr:8-amino-7-oxononanoate synthase [Fibrobacteria bacterium]
MSENPFREALEARRAQGLFRDPAVLDGAPGKWITRDVEGAPKRCLNLASNNSLDLAAHPRLKARAAEALERFGAGSGGSRLLGGNLPIHNELEAALERYRPLTPGARALVFNTGFQANLTVVSAIGELLGGVFADKLAHASVAEGLRLLPREAPFHRFRHNDIGHLEELLKQHQPAAGGLVATESLFSMDGDFAAFEDLCALQKKYGFWLLVDEAHSTGAYPGLHERALRGVPGRTILLGTFGKALGGFGAYVVGAPEVRDFLINFGRGFVFSTSLPPAVIGANLAAMEAADDTTEAWRAEKLAAISGFARAELAKRGFDTGKAVGHIVPVILGDAARAGAVSAALLRHGFHAPAVRPPTVPAGTARLRLSLTAAFEESDVLSLCEALEASVKESGELRA